MVNTKPPRKKPGNPESKLQTACISWFSTQYRKLWEAKKLHAIPNGGKRNLLEAAAMKRSGTVAGVWDLHLTIPKRPYAGMWIEIKATTDLTDNQIAFMESHKDHYAFAVCRSLDEFRKAINDYLV